VLVRVCQTTTEGLELSYSDPLAFARNLVLNKQT